MKTKLKMVLKHTGLKQSWLAEQTRLNATTLNMIVNGKAFPNLRTALKISNVLGLSVEQLWSLDDEDWNEK